MTMRLAGHGISVDLPRGWEARIYRRPEGLPMADVHLAAILRRHRERAGPGPEADPTDRQLLERFTLRRDRDAFAALVRRGERSYFVAKNFEQEARPEQVESLRRFSADLKAALS